MVEVKQFVIGIPILNGYDLLDTTLRSILKGTLLPDVICIIDNGGEFNLEVYKDLHPNIDVFKTVKNLGVAGSWNKIISTYLDHDVNLLIMNHDIQVSEDDLERFLLFAEAHPEADMVHNNSMGDLNGYSFYLIRPICIERIGFFDSNFYPGYFEDNDYDHRLKTNGGTIAQIADLKSVHLGGGSQTVARYAPEQKREHNSKFNKLESLYIRKWGGKPGNEKFTRPFNG